MRDPLPRVQRGLAAALRDRRTQLSAAAFVLTALACYLYVLVGNINNYDNIVCTPEGYGTGLRSGRWMLTLLGDTVGHAMGNFNLPLFNGLLGLAFLGLACQFLWRALHLQKPWQCAVLTAITAFSRKAMFFAFSETETACNITITKSEAQLDTATCSTAKRVLSTNPKNRNSGGRFARKG